MDLTLETKDVYHTLLTNFLAKTFSSVLLQLALGRIAAYTFENFSPISGKEKPLSGFRPSLLSEAKAADGSYRFTPPAAPVQRTHPPQNPPHPNTTQTPWNSSTGCHGDNHSPITIPQWKDWVAASYADIRCKQRRLETTSRKWKISWKNLHHPIYSPKDCSPQMSVELFIDGPDGLCLKIASFTTSFLPLD